MTDRYSQTVAVKFPRSARIKQIAAMTFLLLSLGFILLAAFESLYFLIPFGVFVLIGAVLMQLFNNTPKEYVYDFSLERLTITVKNAVNRQKRLLSVAFTDVTEFGIFADTGEIGDVIACESTDTADVKYVKFRVGEETKRLLFTPDEYMCQLIAEAVKRKENF